MTEAPRKVTWHVPAGAPADGAKDFTSVGVDPASPRSPRSPNAAAAAAMAAQSAPPSDLKESSNVVMYKTPKNTVVTIMKAGMAKALLPWHHTFALGFYAGMYLGFGCLLVVLIGGGLSMDAKGAAALPGASFAAVKGLSSAVFPVGLMLIVIAGAELFTGNLMYLSMAWYAGKIKWYDAVRNLCLCYAGNLAGSLFCAYFFAFLTDTATSPLFVEFTNGMLKSKLLPNWGRIFLRAIACNILVDLALWFAIASDDLTGKMVGIWWPIFTFVLAGYEHSVANMFYLPFALLNDTANATGLTTGDFIWRNLIPVTLGNIVGATIFVSLFYFFIFSPHMGLAIATLTVRPGDAKHRKYAHVTGRAAGTVTPPTAGTVTPPTVGTLPLPTATTMTVTAAQPTTTTGGAPVPVPINAVMPSTGGTIALTVVPQPSPLPSPKSP